MKIRIGTASLYDIAEKACKTYRAELAEAEFYCDIDCIFKSLADVMKLWDAINDFDCEDELVLTIEKQNEQEEQE
jgi:hypothetical protein